MDERGRSARVTDAGAIRLHVVQANPAMDRIELVPSFELGRVNRSTDVRVVAGGKGLNVARGIARLGTAVAAYGFLGGPTGESLRAACQRLGIADRHTRIRGDTRVCTIIVEAHGGRSTVLNEPGPRITRRDAVRLERAILRACRSDDIVALTGSLAPGLPDSWYAELALAVRDRGARVALDASGPPLRLALEGGPWLVKTNALEFAEASGRTPFDSEDELLTAMRAQLDRGSAHVVVTLGARGALAVASTGGWRVRVPMIEPVNPTGSGDMFLAGLLVGIGRGHAQQEALRLAAACGLANAMLLEPDLPSRSRVRRLMRGVRVEDL